MNEPSRGINNPKKGFSNNLCSLAPEILFMELSAADSCQSQSIAYDSFDIFISRPSRVETGN